MEHSMWEGLLWVGAAQRNSMDTTLHDQFYPVPPDVLLEIYAAID